MLKWIYIFLLFFSTSAIAQTHCASVELFLEDQGNSMFVFDNFSTYQSGYPRTTVARLKVRVLDKETPDNLCSWNLTIDMDNNGAPIDEWEELHLYGDGSGNNPLLDIVEIRVTNDCLTSLNYSNFVSLNEIDDVLDIIEPVIGVLEASDVIPAGSCTKNVNGAGDYINNYSEYTFKIELRIKPGMSYNPGKFALSFNFRLEENI